MKDSSEIKPILFGNQTFWVQGIYLKLSISGVMVIMLEKEHDNQSSNPGQSCLILYRAEAL